MSTDAQAEIRYANKPSTISAYKVVAVFVVTGYGGLVDTVSTYRPAHIPHM